MELKRAKIQAEINIKKQQADAEYLLKKKLQSQQTL
ncbi:hypothetical protein WSI_05090 [Candidatus Liberibacter asiaticus str. gxpsy]|uniref:Uncharacterized protein n=2 Tax=Liberibacter asiaticus TaxID=34021 RepID=C6XGW3_LIBAP|nr:hypothetical protein CLIBASIA_05235 [Candidatus Liberibacter asiaticus str. psy62]AGH17380.1 hypothetical protein WSI_05090 [Candidatus Liberibacter asiaticus str. gxpsy]BAP26912.1 hypothetical protein CGUJ_05235 [Candidatus Liberibacter asiaticus str. Ishi-1]